ncbi:hypothetical protein V2J09_006108 [Rumex salicifolius]
MNGLVLYRHHSEQDENEDLSMAKYRNLISIPLMSWILNTIEASLRSTISYRENAKDLWDDIQDRFCVINGPRIQQLICELAETKQRGMSIITYYGKLKFLWDDLGSYDPIPVCTCLKCTCDINSRLAKRNSVAQVHQFLMGLDSDVCGTIGFAILGTDLCLLS